MLSKRNWPLLLPIAVGLALAGSYFYVLNMNKTHYYPAEKIIKSVRSYFKDVSGSYILYEPTTYRKFGIEYEVYKGGISAERNGKVYNYEFIADAYNGQVMDIFEI
ncbi:hypothetical protein DOS70_06065 [Staphylococcus felis]|uniref:Peptidase n=1 Tax=Staphylococcus felis TaxID=46127 RepID=A0A2K3ZFG8_9STAP|nr:hypothetical protein [Staphylococcus felis]AVP37331.1 hypothetical protein C7J90_10265 [Staphylococcus felis]MBH9580226.1 hypothetical protein [Staphylococcus felis]MDM8327296.1 hypothetical protein [Staphylococcus felis]PNZ36615.1 hypothetical protein CD143_03775 [Staphylococcus felis]QQB02721.1 hypothetical protein I6H71_08240 [Staphylococcus felis]